MGLGWKIYFLMISIMFNFLSCHYSKICTEVCQEFLKTFCPQDKNLRRGENRLLTCFRYILFIIWSKAYLEGAYAFAILYDQKLSLTVCIFDEKKMRRIVHWNYCLSPRERNITLPYKSKAFCFDHCLFDEYDWQLYHLYIFIHRFKPKKLTLCQLQINKDR